RTKLLLAQVPLALALLVVGVVSGVVTKRLGEQSRLILADNYRSVLAAQKMKEALERIDSGALFILAGHSVDAARGIDRHRGVFEDELRVQEGNITEPGEHDVKKRLRVAWDEYQKALNEYQTLTTREVHDQFYFATLQPTFLRIKDAADEILAINQDAMVRK